MAATQKFIAMVNADGSATLLGLLATRDATGPAAPDESHGNLVKQADLSSIVLSVYDRDSLTPNTPVFVETLSISEVIYDELQTTGVWTKLDDGGNFLCDLAATVFPDGNHIYELKLAFTTTGGTVSWGHYSLTTLFTDRP